MSNKFRLALLALVSILPSFVLRPIYRYVFGYSIGKRVRFGFSIIDAAECEIGDDVSIGHLNIFTGSKRLIIGDHSRVGHLNVFRGGDEIRLGRYSEVVRLNEINSIPNPDVRNDYDPTFVLGDGAVVVASHKIDFTDRVQFGKRVILGGRNSSLWTHNRQSTLPIVIGDNSYLGSEIRIAPGGGIPKNCVVGIGSVITKNLSGEYKLIAGVPAEVIKDLDEAARELVHFKTRADLPDDI